MLDYESLSPGTRERVEELAKNKNCSIDTALEEIVIEGIAMGGLTQACKPKPRLEVVKSHPEKPPDNVAQIRPRKTPN